MKSLTVLLLGLLYAYSSPAQLLPGLLSPPPSAAPAPSATPAIPAPIFSNLNFPTAYVVENPAFMVYQEGARVSLLYDRVEEVQGYGAEVGYGQDMAGFGLEYYDADCDGCNGKLKADFALTLADTGIGLRVGEDIYGAGLLFNVPGRHRFGLAYEVSEGGGSGNRIDSYGAGYYFIDPAFILSLDLSRQEFENPAFNDDILVVAPGVLFFVGENWQLSASDRISFDDGRKVDDDVWLGLGWGNPAFYLAAYSNFQNATSASASFFF